MAKQLTPKSHRAALARYCIAQVLAIAETYKQHRRNAILGTATEEEEAQKLNDEMYKLASELNRQAHYIRELAKS